MSKEANNPTFCDFTLVPKTFYFINKSDAIAIAIATVVAVLFIM